jgi:hypothetical protein
METYRSEKAKLCMEVRSMWAQGSGDAGGRAVVAAGMGERMGEEVVIWRTD